MKLVVVLFIVLVSFLHCSCAFDISFIRTDDKESSVPLSAKYREQLRKLCKILETNSKLPKDLEAKKEELGKMCLKLKQDDENIEGAGSGITLNKFAKKALIVGALVGSGWFAWKNAHILLPYIPFLGGGGEKNKIGYGQDMMKDLREARLKKFGTEPVKID